VKNNADREQAPMTVRSANKSKGMKDFLARNFSYSPKEIRQIPPTTKKDITSPECQPFAWYEAREKGSRMRAKPAEMSMRPMTITW
jgi:hypothetical protein